MLPVPHGRSGGDALWLALPPACYSFPEPFRFGPLEQLASVAPLGWAERAREQGEGQVDNTGLEFRGILGGKNAPSHKAA